VPLRTGKVLTAVPLDWVECPDHKLRDDHRAERSPGASFLIASAETSGLGAIEGRCQQSVSTPASLGHGQHHVAFSERLLSSSDVRRSKAREWRVWRPHSLHTAEATGHPQARTLRSPPSTRDVRWSKVGMEDKMGVAHGHVSRQRPSLRLRSAWPAGTGPLPGAVADALVRFLAACCHWCSLSPWRGPGAALPRS